MSLQSASFNNLDIISDHPVPRRDLQALCGCRLGVTITADDLQCISLYPSRNTDCPQLPSSVIDYYLKLIRHSSPSSVFIYPSAFSNRLCSNDLASICAWTSSETYLFGRNALLIPSFVNNRWNLFFVDLVLEEITQYATDRSPDSGHLEQLCSYLTKEVRLRGILNIDVYDFLFEYRRLPHSFTQMDDGLNVCETARCLLQGYPKIYKPAPDIWKGLIQTLLISVD